MTNYKIFKNPDKDGDSNRLIKLESLIQNIVSDFFAKQEIIDEENQILSVIVSRISLTGDLRLAKIFVRCFNKTEIDKVNFIKILEENSANLRRIFAKKIYIKYPPQIKFYYEESFDMNQDLIEIFIRNNVIEKN